MAAAISKSLYELLYYHIYDDQSVNTFTKLYLELEGNFGNFRNFWNFHINFLHNVKGILVISGILDTL